MASHTNTDFPGLRSILVGTNITEEGGHAIRAAQHIRPEGAQLHVSHCHEGGDREEIASRFSEHLNESGLASSAYLVHLRGGAPHRELRAVAEEVEADLIVLGSHRPRRALDGLLGTTADRVIRTSRRPCLVVNQEITAPPRRILVAWDLSPVSNRSLDTAVSWASAWAGGNRAEDSTVHIDILHVFDFARPGYVPSGKADTALAKRAVEIRSAMGPRVSVSTRTISSPLAPEGILRASEEARSDLVFLGTHGYGYLLRTLLGSVSSEVVRTMRLPVVVVPPGPEDTTQ